MQPVAAPAGAKMQECCWEALPKRARADSATLLNAADVIAAEPQEAIAPALAQSPAQDTLGQRSPEEAVQHVSSPAEPVGELAMDMSLTFNVPVEGASIGAATPTPSSVMDCGTTHLARL